MHGIACMPGLKAPVPKIVPPLMLRGSISASLLGCAWLGPLLLLNAGKGQQEAEGRQRRARGSRDVPFHRSAGASSHSFSPAMRRRELYRGPGSAGLRSPLCAGGTTRSRCEPPFPFPLPLPFPLPARGSRRSSALCSTARPRTGHPGRGSRRFSGTFRVSAPAAAGGGVGVPAAPLPPGRPSERVALHAVKTPCALRCSAGEEQRIYVRSECPVPQR